MRDRIVAMVIGTAAVLAAAYLLVVSPELRQASSLGGQVSSAQAQLSSAEGELATARSAQAQYASAYAAVVSLGKAVPASQEVPSLIFELEQASSSHRVEFASISAGTGAGSTAGQGGSAAAAAASAAGFTAMPFTFVFNGSFFDLEHLLERVQSFATRTSTGTLQISGRLLTIQSVKLAPADTGTVATGSNASQLSGSITATAYVLPASQGLTGSATATATATAGGGASSPGSGSSPSTAAVVIR